MKNGGNSRFAKVVLLVLLGTWAVLVLDLTTADPSQWLVIALTGFIFSLVGRLWRIEVDYWLGKLSPVTINFGGNDNE